MTMIMIDHEEHELEALPEAVRDELVSLKFVQDELHRLEMLIAALKNAERDYAEALQNALIKYRGESSSNHQ